MGEFENVPDGEALRIANIVKLTLEHLGQRCPGTAPARRGVHPKDHGCVEAKFTVLESIPKDFQVGVFAKPGQQFDALIRFSNADIDSTKRDSSPGQDSTGKDIVLHGSRGMAVKLLDVNGTALMPTKGPLTQDFLMINQPVFAFANVEDYEVLVNANDVPKAFLAERSKSTDKNVLDRTKVTGGIFQRIAGLAPPFQPAPISPVDNQYFSGAAFLFGSDRVMKYSAKPVAPKSGSPSASDVSGDNNKNYLRKGLINRMAEGGDDVQNIVFEFQLQVRDMKSLEGKIDSDIENVCTPWTDKFETVATITIPPQDIDSAERRALCEDLIFSPWNGLVEHRPIGGINRLRRDVYVASAGLRHAQPTPTLRRGPRIK
jgi:hypothetical protein